MPFASPRGLPGWPCDSPSCANQIRGDAYGQGRVECPHFHGGRFFGLDVTSLGHQGIEAIHQLADASLTPRQIRQGRSRSLAWAKRLASFDFRELEFFQAAIGQR